MTSDLFTVVVHYILEAAPETEAEGGAETDGKNAKKKGSSGYTINCTDINSSLGRTAICQNSKVRM